MPGKDKTGPIGKGEATGRGLGDCEVTDEQQEQRPGLGGGGCRRGAGRADRPGGGRNQGGNRGKG